MLLDINDVLAVLLIIIQILGIAVIISMMIIFATSLYYLTALSIKVIKNELGKLKK